jgi:tRNA nucleotidyltransferase (CCA-adding enzyme)
MHIILTHEQTDFDAVASLLAARLLDVKALAVLPRRLNRNVRAYLTLYGAALPFMEYRDLPRGKIERVTLVDTQSAPSVKGFGKHTSVHVVDHHPLDGELPGGWTAHIEEIGATTTLLAETLRDQRVDLDLASATLLLLGIYEDTGSLSYPSTTPRDAQAAAWLLDRGASLSIANDFLNHPLSSDQRRLFNQLFEDADTVVLHGLSIVIACGTTDGMVDEISTLAHKLRDLFDPDGLIVLVALNGGVQLVARSAHPALNIARVAEHFGGGGHSQAAAALIRDQGVEQIKAELLKVLPTVIQPPKTVAEIMSRGPQVLKPQESIRTAAEQMQRFGHEGYPVVKAGRVVGLLTRRAVDRAVTHGMGKDPIETIMDAGDLSVAPTDSVGRLQRLMIQYGWGQVPVVDPDSAEIVGIVTRTDLLKELAPDRDQDRQRGFRDRLEAALPGERLALLKLVARLAEERKDALYIVGGFVRDLLLGAPSVDFDLVVEGDAIGLASDLAGRYGGRVSSHRRFGTAKWQLDMDAQSFRDALKGDEERIENLPKTLDFVSARTEFYTHPTALPSVERGSIKLDLHRRDFTINTLALRLDGHYYGQLLDHWGGGRDLQDHQIRVLHSLSFVDDPTRMLRAVRLEQRLNFEIEARTRELLEQAKPLLDRVSGDRIRSELEQMFSETRMFEMMVRLEELQLWGAIHPALGWGAWQEDYIRRARGFIAPEAWNLTRPVGFQLLFYAGLCLKLTGEQARGVCTRLSMPEGAAGDILDANVLLGTPPATLVESSPSRIVARLDGLREAAIVSTWLALDDNPEAQAALAKYLSTWRSVMPISDGSVLRERGLPPGPAYSRILWKLRSGWLDGEIQDEADELRALDQLVQEAKSRA